MPGLQKIRSTLMRETNFLVENNARHLWHPMAHPAEMRAQPPRIINAASGAEITDLQGKTVLDAVGGLWNVNLGYSCEPVKAASEGVLAFLLRKPAIQLQGRQLL